MIKRGISNNQISSNLNASYPGEILHYATWVPDILIEGERPVNHIITEAVSTYSNIFPARTDSLEVVLGLLRYHPLYRTKGLVRIFSTSTEVISDPKSHDLKEFLAQRRIKWHVKDTRTRNGKHFMERIIQSFDYYILNTYRRQSELLSEEMTFDTYKYLVAGCEDFHNTVNPCVNSKFQGKVPEAILWEAIRTYRRPANKNVEGLPKE